MAGHAKNVEEEWTRSIDHLRDMARQNEESLVRNKRLTSVLSVPNRELIDGIEHVVTALDAVSYTHLTLPTTERV